MISQQGDSFEISFHKMADPWHATSIMNHGMLTHFNWDVWADKAAMAAVAWTHEPVMEISKRAFYISALLEQSIMREDRA